MRKDQKVTVTALYLGMISLLNTAWPTAPMVARTKNKLPNISPLTPLERSGCPTITKTPIRLIIIPQNTFLCGFSPRTKIERR